VDHDIEINGISRVRIRTLGLVTDNTELYVLTSAPLDLASVDDLENEGDYHPLKKRYHAASDSKQVASLGGR
jgi:hypothetical protein